MKKIADKILNTAIVIVVILNLLSYQLFLPSLLSHAQEANDTAAEVSIAPEPSDSVSAPKEESDTKDEAVEPPVEEVVPPKEDTVDPIAEESVVPTVEVIAPVEAEIPAGQENLAENTIPADNDAPIVSGNLQPENNDCDSSCSAEESACPAPDCAGALSSANTVENSANIAEAVSNTGGNVIENPATIGAENNEPITDESNPKNSPVGETENNPAGNDAAEVSESEYIAPEKPAVIETGDAAAKTLAVNAVNTNIYTENGAEYIKNITEDYTGDVNLLEAFNDILDSAQNLNQENQEAVEHITIINANTAEKVENIAVAEASSGDNTILNGSGTADIKTGDAEASASIFNLINTNIVGDNWLFAVINNVGNWTGDLIVPGAGLLNAPPADMVFDKIVNNNLAENIKNFLSSSANSGGNASDSKSGSAEIGTGEAVASSSAVNIVNTNITRNNWFFLMINNSGQWLGKVVNWNGEDPNQGTAYEYDFGSLSEFYQPSKIVSVYNSNKAEEVANTVSASANTGDNRASAEGDAAISTGNASAWASAFNFVNTNITGNNWLFGVVNNAGNWKGDVVFAYPDLSIGLSADKEKIQPGDSLVYTITYKNGGKAKCGNVDLMLSLPEYFSYQSDSQGGVRSSGRDYFWSVAGLDPGEEESFRVTVDSDIQTPRDVLSLESVAGVKTDTEEKELSNNYDSEKTGLLFITNPQITIQNNVLAIPKSRAKLSIERREDATVAVGNISNHSILVKNRGKEILYNVEVKERIKNPAGEKMAEYVWQIAKLKKGQSALIEYQIFADPLIALGGYKHTASARAIDYYGRKVEGKSVSQIVAFVSGSSSHVIVGAGEELVPTVEAAETSTPAVLGVRNSARDIPWQWLLALLALPLAQMIRKKKLYQKRRLVRLVRQTSSAIFSFLF